MSSILTLGLLLVLLSVCAGRHSWAPASHRQRTTVTAFQPTSRLIETVAVNIVKHIMKNRDQAQVYCRYAGGGVLSSTLQQAFRVGCRRS
jgi:hypothetical protein